jgi:multimeric flavodoxin WrbA
MMKTFVVKEFDAPVPGGAEVFDLTGTELRHCAGCWSCWLKTPGKCIFRDMDAFYRGFLASDKTIIYCDTSQGFVTSNLKAMIDRMIPFILPYISWPKDESIHDPRYEKYPATVNVFYRGEFLPGEEEAFTAYFRRTLGMMYVKEFDIRRYESAAGAEYAVEAEAEAEASAATISTATIATKASSASTATTVSANDNKTLIINGSPNGKKGNSEIICRKFSAGMKSQPEVRYVVDEDPEALAAYMDRFDRWLFFFPLYVNAMPGIVMRLFEHMHANPDKQVGFFVQSGFEESAQSDYLCAILKNFIRRMGYKSLGLVVAGGMAGVRYMPERMNKKLFERLAQAGVLYEESGAFADETIKHFGRLRSYSKTQLIFYRFMAKIGVTNLFWNSMLKQNKTYQKRFDKPFGV